MTDDTPNLILEHLRQIRAATDKSNAKLSELEKHLIELRLQVAGVVREDVLIHSKLAEHEARFERIEKRLELHE